MKLRVAFSASLKDIRQAKGLTQEDFGVVSSRTYISMLERGLRTPTLEKIEQLAKAMKVHPVTLVALTYMKARAQRDPRILLSTIEKELTALLAPRT